MKHMITLAVIFSLLLLGCQAILSLVDPEDEFQENMLSSGLTLDYPSYHENEIILSGNETMVISDQIVGNITLSGNASVRVIGETLVHGLIHLTENSTLLIKNSRFDLQPPPIGVDEIVVHIQGTSRLWITSNALVTFHPQPIMHLDKALRNNASFVEVDDEGEILIEDSTFTGYLPGDVIYEATKVTAGTFLITGYGKFTAHRSTINCYLNYTIITGLGDPYVEMERWFWISSQRFGTIRVENTTCTLHEPGQTVFKPTNGYIILKNSTIYGNVRPETISTFQIEDCEIYNIRNQIGYGNINEALEVNDHSVGTIKRTRLIGEVKLGWASTNEFLGTSDPVIEMEECEIDGELIDLFANTTLIMKDCEILDEHCLLEMSDNTRLVIDGTDIPDLHIHNGTQEVLREIHENIEISVRNCSIGYIHHANIDRPITSKIDVGEEGYISDLDLWVSDPDLQHDLNLTLLDGGAVSINNSDDWDIEVILRNSDPPEINTSRSLRSIERYYKRGTFLINDEPIEGALVKLMGGEILMEQLTGPDGKYEFILDSSIEDNGEVLVNIDQDLTLTAEYLDIMGNATIDTTSDQNNLFDLTDRSAPVFIGKISWSPDMFDQKKYIHVRCEAEDEDSGVISEIILQYRIDDGKWTNMTMFHTGDSTYEAVLPRFDIGDRVEMRVQATDPFNNTAMSSVEKMDIGREILFSGLAFLVILTIIILIIIVLLAIPKMNRKPYLKSDFTGERDPLGDQIRAEKKSNDDQGGGEK